MYLLCWLPLAAAHGALTDRCPNAADTRRDAQELCGTASVADSLRSVGLGIVAARGSDEHGHHEVPKALLVLLREHGFHTALDLRLLDQRGQETAELMDQLRLGGVSIGHRSKVRLLLGDNHHGGGDIRTTSDCGEPKTMARISADRGSHCRRQLQDASSSSDGGGMSADTIAIVLSVLVGAAGYLVQAYTARQAERSLAEQAQEQHAHELAQQKNHERMVAQIARTDRAVDDCCTPVIRGLGSYLQARTKFVAAFASKLETSHPEAFTDLYTRDGYAMKNGLELVAGSDGAVRWAGQLIIDPTRTMGHTWAAPTFFNSVFVGCSARAVDVSVQDGVALVTKPFVRELPEAFFELMAADLDGSLAEDYRSYIRSDIKPALDLITDTLHAHFAALELPTSEWLLETFPGHTTVDSPSNIVDSLVAYSRAFGRVLAGWDAGRLDLLFPRSHMMPWASLKGYFEYSRQLGEAKQHELIGMSSGKRDAFFAAADLAGAIDGSS